MFGQLKKQATEYESNNVGFSSLTKLNFQNKNLFLGKIPVKKKARKQLFKNIKFSDTVYKKLSKKFSDQELQVILNRFIKDVDRKKIIVKHNNKEIIDVSNTKQIHFDNYKILDDLEKFIKKHNLEIDVAKSSHITKNGELKLDLINSNIEIDVFKALGLDEGYDNDVYRFGTTVINDQNGIQGSSVESFIERLICENGMVSNEMNYKSTIKDRDPYKKFIQKVATTLTDNDVLKQFQHSMLNNIERMFKNQASINELENIVQVFKKYEDRDDKVENLFQLNKIKNKYGDEIFSKSKKWKSTANSGIKLYDLMNVSTFLVSHNKLENLELSDKIKVNQDITNTFFKKEYDLENVAPTLNINEDLLGNVRQQFRLN